MREVIFLAPLPTMSKRTRLSKMIDPVLNSGCIVSFFGWEREPGEMENFRTRTSGVSEKAILRGGGYASRRARMMYPLWMMVVFLRVLLLGRERVIFALGWETAFPALLASMLTRSRIVFDDADRFSMIVKLPKPANLVLQKLERWASYRSQLHIVPGMARYEWRHDRMVVLRNTPLAKDFDGARAAAPERPPHELVIYANGWIGETRGAPVFLEALNLAAKRGIDVRFLISGRVDGPSAPHLINHPAVSFAGELTQKDALALYAVCDAVLTYYDPNIPINRLAESNKWGDAVVLGCPIIVNSEVETARELVDRGAAFSVPYHDVDGLVALWQRLIEDPTQFEKADKALAELKSDFPEFDTQFVGMLNRLKPYGE